jgi:hypothetical protein
MIISDATAAALLRGAAKGIEDGTLTLDDLKYIREVLKYIESMINVNS